MTALITAIRRSSCAYRGLKNLLSYQTFPKDLLSPRLQNSPPPEEKAMHPTVNERPTQSELRNLALAIGVAMHLDAALPLLPEQHEAAKSLRQAQKSAMKLVRYLRAALPDNSEAGA